MTASRSVTRYYLSRDEGKSADDIRLKGRQRVRRLAPGQLTRATATLVLRDGAPEGAYHLVACADDRGEVLESREGNNCRPAKRPTTIPGSPPPPPPPPPPNPSCTTADPAASEYAWAQPDWRRTWSGGPLADDRGFAVKASDDAVYVAGVSGSGEGGGDLLLLRYSPTGELEWQQEWGGLQLDQAQAIALADDGVYVVGSEASTGGGVLQSVLLHFSYEGELLAERIWNPGRLSTPQAIVARGDALYVAGLTHPEAGNRDAYLARLEQDGDIVWHKSWGGAKWDEIWDIQVGESGLYAVGYTTPADTEKTDNLLLIVDPESGAIRREVQWGGPGNDEARALALEGDTLWIGGGGQRGTSGDAFLARASDGGDIEWTRYAGGKMSGAYGIAVGERGIYLAGGSYDFPAGGDMAVARFDRDGTIEWSQIFGQPGFWDWGFDVHAADGKFYVTGTLYTQGEGWYEILTVAYDEQFRSAVLSDVMRGAQAGDSACQATLDHFWIGDLLRFAQPAEEQVYETTPPREGSGQWTSESPPGTTPPPAGGGLASINYSGGSDFGRRRGEVWVDPTRDPPAGQENAPDALTGVMRDFPSNPALVRDYSGITGELFDGAIRYRYYISHDRAIPQGGYITVGEITIPLPPPPV